MWQEGLLAGLGWEWQSVDGSMVKAPLGQEAVGPNPTDRGKKGRNGVLRPGHTDYPSVSYWTERTGMISGYWKKLRGPLSPHILKE
jgi:hypothetical protein